MAFSAEMLEKTFPVARSTRDNGYITDVRIYWNDAGTALSLNGVPLTGGQATQRTPPKQSTRLNGSSRARAVSRSGLGTARPPNRRAAPRPALVSLRATATTHLRRCLAHPTDLGCGSCRAA